MGEKEFKSELEKILNKDFLPVHEGLRMFVVVDHEAVIQKFEKTYGLCDSDESHRLKTDAINKAYSIADYRLRNLWDYSRHKKEPLIKSPRYSHAQSEPEELYPIDYYIEWAQTKKIEIPWLEWAQEEGLVSKNQSSGSCEDLEITPHPMKKRTYLRIILALLEKEGIDVADVTARDNTKQQISELCGSARPETVDGLLDELRSKKAQQLQKA